VILGVAPPLPPFIPTPRADVAPGRVPARSVARLTPAQSVSARPTFAEQLKAAQPVDADPVLGWTASE